MSTTVEGFVAPGFESVRARFDANFAEGLELGAAFAVYLEGRLVVDLWGGIADPQTDEPWREDTLCLTYSGTKGLVATCVLRLVDHGLLDLETPVCRFWPEFAAHGKEDVLVRHVVSHQAGMPGLRRRVALDEVHDVDRMTALLAEETLFWPAGSRTWYHPLTYGWLCAELLRRITGRSLGDYLRTEVAEPLGLEVWIGLPAELEPRVARCRVAADWQPIDPDAPAGEISARDVRDIWRNPDLFTSDLPWNGRAFHAGEIPGANAIGTARAMAHHYGVLANGGSEGEVTILTLAAIALGQRQLARGIDPCHGKELRMGVGWGLQTEAGEFGPVGVAFGHGGAGGSLHGAWPQQRIGFSYVMNRMRSDDEDPRAVSLLEALHSCL